MKSWYDPIFNYVKHQLRLSQTALDAGDSRLALRFLVIPTLLLPVALAAVVWEGARLGWQVFRDWNFGRKT